MKDEIEVIVRLSDMFKVEGSGAIRCKICNEMIDKCTCIDDMIRFGQTTAKLIRGHKA